MIPIVAALFLTAAALGADAWLVRTDKALDLVTPEPSKVVQGFVGALAAGRPEIAEHQLASETRADDATERLRAWAEALRARHGDFRFEDGEPQQDGDLAEVLARLRTARDGTLERRFRLARDPESRLWKITAYEERA